MGPGTDDPLTQAQRLEEHLAREFISGYVAKSAGSAVLLDANKLFLAARMSGFKVSTRALNKVLTEMVSK